MRQITISALGMLFFLAGALIEAKPVSADDAQDARQLVEKARLTFENFQADPHMGPNLRALLTLSALITAACGTLVGAGVGAAGGAAVGAATGHDPGRSALIGAGVGAAGGAVYDIVH